MFLVSNSSSRDNCCFPFIEVAGSSQNPMPGGASCASVDFLGSDLDCGEVAGFSSSIGESQERDRSLTKGLRGGYTCSVPGCYKNTKKNKEVSFHRFPKNKQLRDKWINVIKRKKFVRLIIIEYAQAILRGEKEEMHQLFQQYFH